MTRLEQPVLQVLSSVLRIGAGHPLRVGIDGFCAAGKTTFADQLGAALITAGRPVIRATTDDFQNPAGIRWQLGPDSSEGFYRHAVDVEALRRELLEPLGPGGTRKYRTSVYDIRALRPNLSAISSATNNAVLIVDRLFLHVPELRSNWEYSVFINADFNICIARPLRRNQEGRADPAELEGVYRRRYVPGFAQCMSEVAPQDIATFCFTSAGE